MLQFFGQFHPVVVHFPLALLLVAMVTEAVSWAARKPALHEFGGWNLQLGAAGAVVAAALGWALAEAGDVETAMRQTLFWHRWLGVAAAVWAVATVVLWHWSRNARNGREGEAGPGEGRRLAIYRAMLLIGGTLVAITGHLGGVLIYGADYYVWSLK